MGWVVVLVSFPADLGVIWVNFLYVCRLNLIQTRPSQNTNGIYIRFTSEESWPFHTLCSYVILNNMESTLTIMFFFGTAYTYTAWVYFLFQQLTELYFNSQQKIYISQSAQKEIDMYPLFSLYVWNV